MKSIKKILSLALCGTLILGILLALASCIGSESDTEGTCTVVIGSDIGFTEYLVDISKVEINEGLFSLIKYLEEEKGLHAVYESSVYGAYLTEIGTLVPDEAKGEYIAVYTSVASEFNTGSLFAEYNYAGTSLGTSGLGMSAMSVVSGGVYLFMIATYTF